MIAMFSCPAGKKKYGEMHDIEYCVTQCDEPCYSPHLMTAIWSVNAKNHHKGRYISATALSGCKRRLTLERTVPVADQFSNLYAAFRGTITHTVMEEASSAVLPSGRTLEDYGYLSEWSMLVGFCFVHGGFQVDADLDVDDMATYAQLSCPDCEALAIYPLDQDTILLGGTLDAGLPVFTDLQFDLAKFPAIFIDEEGTAHYKLDDLKTQKEYAIRLFIKGDPKNTLHPAIKDDYVRQARVYAYLAYICKPPKHLRDRGVKRIKFVTSNIQAFAMGEAPYTGSGSVRWKDDYRHPLKDWPLYPIDLGTREWVEEYIATEARPILNSLILGTERGKVRSEEQAWLCNDYCAFVGSTHCPNPALEATLIENGAEPERAFQMAARQPVELLEKVVEPLNKYDTINADNFFRKQRGEAVVELEAKPRATKPKAEKPVKEPAVKKPRKKKGE